MFLGVKENLGIFSTKCPLATSLDCFRVPKNIFFRKTSIARIYSPTWSSFEFFFSC